MMDLKLEIIENDTAGLSKYTATFSNESASVTGSLPAGWRFSRSQACFNFPNSPTSILLLNISGNNYL